MHFIDLITPIKINQQTSNKKLTTTLLKSALKNSARSTLKSKNVSINLNSSNKLKEKIKLKSKETFQELNKTQENENLKEKSDSTNLIEHISLSSTIESIPTNTNEKSTLNENSIIEISSDLINTETISIQNTSTPNKKLLEKSEITSKNITQSPKKNISITNLSAKKQINKFSTSLSSSSSKSKTILQNQRNEKISSNNIRKILSPKVRNLNKSTLQKQISFNDNQSSIKKISQNSTTHLLKQKSESVDHKMKSSIAIRRSSQTELKSITLKRLQQNVKPLTNALRRRLDYAAGLAKTGNNNKSTLNSIGKFDHKKLNQTLGNQSITKNLTPRLSKSVTEKSIKSSRIGTISKISINKSKLPTKLPTITTVNSGQEKNLMVHKKKIDDNSNKTLNIDKKDEQQTTIIKEQQSVDHKSEDIKTEEITSQQVCV